MENNVRLFIQGQLIEVDIEDIDIDYQITDIATMGNIDSSKSFPISAPMTQSNNRAFGHLQDLSVDNPLPRRKLACTLDQGGTPLLQGGVCRIKKTSRAYELELGGGNYNLLDSVKDLKLADLDWSEFDHFWTLANVHASRTNTDGYIYLANDYFIDQATSLIDNIDRVIRADYIYPCVFVHTILRKMGEQTGIKLVGDLLNSQAFEDLVLPFTRTEYIRNRIADRYLVSFSLFGNAIASNPFPVVALYTFVSSQGNYFTISSNANYNLGVLLLADNTDISLQLVLNVEKLSPGAGTLTIFFDYADGFTVSQIQRTINITTGIGQYNLTQDLSIIGIDIAESLSISFQSPDSGVLVLSTSTVSIVKATIRAGDPIVYSNTLRSENYVTLSSALPDMSCGDLLKALANMYGLLFQYDAFTNTVRVEQISKLYSNIPYAKDWTDKIDPTTKEVEYELGNYGQTNRMLLDNPDTLDPLQGSYTFTIDHEHLDPEKEVFKLPFQWTDNVQKLEDLTLAYIPILEAEEDPENPGDYLYSLGGDSKPRILTVVREDVTANPLDYYDGTSTVSSNTAPLGYYFRAGASNNLDLNSLVNTNQLQRISMLQKAIKVTIEADLTSADIAELDFFFPIYVRTWAKYFFLNRISRKPNEMSKLVLVEL